MLSSLTSVKQKTKQKEDRLDNPHWKSLIELLNKRRSIRKYKDKAVDPKLLDQVLKAAQLAPSGKNRQNWRFFVAQGEKRDQYLEYSQKTWMNIKDILKVKLKPSLYEFTERFFYTLGGAPIVVFCYSHNSPDEKYLTSIGSVYMAVENLNLACNALGLGCCTMGAPLEIKKEVDEFVGVVERDDYKRGELELLCAVVIGWPDHDPPQAPRQIEDRVHYLK